MNLAHGVDLDVALRSVASLPSQNVPGYVALDENLGWKLSKDVELSISGYNLLDKRHREFGTTATGSEIGRIFYVKILWKL